MKSLPSLLGGLALLFTATSAMAAAPAAVAPPTTPAAKTDAKPPASAPAPVTSTAPAAPVSKLDDYFNAMVATLNLSDSEKTQIEDLYHTDVDAIHAICNNDSLSPLQQSQQVSDLRDVRNEKVVKILSSLDRQKDFYEVEAAYRAAVVEFAMGGAPATVPPPAEAAPAAPATPATPAKKDVPGATSTAKPAPVTPPAPPM